MWFGEHYSWKVREFEGDTSDYDPARTTLFVLTSPGVPFASFTIHYIYICIYCIVVPRYSVVIFKLRSCACILGLRLFRNSNQGPVQFLGNQCCRDPVGANSTRQIDTKGKQ